MNILLSIIICSSIAQECMPPIAYKDLFPTEYDCLHFGYQESQKRLEAIGKHDVNKFGMFIRFTCTPTNTIWLQPPQMIMREYLLIITYP